jgi:hypothetical protein
MSLGWRKARPEQSQSPGERPGRTRDRIAAEELRQAGTGHDWAEVCSSPFA